MNKKGVTLLELMIVIAVIALLVIIAVPRFSDLVNKSREGATKNALSTVRAAIQVYYGDNDGWFPASANALDSLLLNGKYLNEMPIAKVPGTGHADASVVRYFSTEINGVPVGGAGGGLFGVFGAIDQGGWAYMCDNTQPAYWGLFMVNCTHKDIKGETSWTGF